MLSGLRDLRPTGVTCVALVVALSVAGCGATHHPARHSTSASSVRAVRWWSNSAVTVGSMINPAHPDAGAADLHPSPADYCGMLKQTVAAGKSILPGITATDPALLTSATAFLAEIQKVAPAGITAQWHVLGPAVLALVKSGGDTSKVDLGAVTSAAKAVAADSKANCNVDISSVTGLLPAGG